jgi:hypothetical protein
MNAIRIAILCGGAAILIIYLIIIEKFTLSQIPSVFAMLFNLFGLTLGSILLGFGKFYEVVDFFNLGRRRL